MGRSMGLASNADQLEKVPASITVVSPLFNRAYTVFREGSDLYQSEREYYSVSSYFITDKHKLEYVIGSGLHGQTYLVSRRHYLFQAPLSFYSKRQRWDLSPGYELAEFGFDRPISRGCLTCHTNSKLLLASKGDQAVPSPAAKNQEVAIGCENCHGPGQLHVAERRKGIKLSGGLDTSIVNPAKLPSQLAEDICMSCHQGKDLRLLQPGKDFCDFRPGRPLRETLAIFTILPKRNDPPRSDLVDHHFSLRASECYLKSQGRLSCLSCHNPHEEVPAEAAADYYRSKCLTCHKETSCTLSLAERARRRGTDDCAACHMPKRAPLEIPHAALTNHRIGGREGDPFPESAFQLIPELPDLIYLNGPSNPNADALPVEVLHQAYDQLIRKRPEYRKQYLMLRTQRKPQ